MITPKDALNAFGAPEHESHMTGLVLPSAIVSVITTIPKKIYCNMALQAPLYNALNYVIERGLSSKIKTWDGCFNIRTMKGSKGKKFSLHAWGLAIDINATDNPYSKVPKMDLRLVQCFKDAGFDWGGDWAVPDGMHFQLSKLGPSTPI